MIGPTRLAGLSFIASTNWNGSARKPVTAQPISRAELGKSGFSPTGFHHLSTPRKTLPPLKSFKISTQVPAPLSRPEMEGLIERLQFVLPPSVVSQMPSDALAVQKILYQAGSRIAKTAMQPDSPDLLPIGLVIYKEQKAQPRLLKVIELPRATILTEASQPVTQAAYGISLLRADLPRHLPPAFLTKFLEPIWQFFARKHDKALYPAKEEARYLKTVMQPWQQAPKQPEDVLEFSNQDYDELLLHAHAVPLGLKITDESARTNYGCQILRMWQDIAAAMEAHDALPDAIVGSKLGKICLNTKSGELEYHDMSARIAELLLQASGQSNRGQQEAATDQTERKEPHEL